MRKRLATLALAITSLVVIAFTIPLMLVIRRQAMERAQVEAEGQAQSLAALVAIAVAREEQVSAEALDRALGSLPDGVGLALPGGEVMGDISPASNVVAATRAGSPSSGFSAGGWEVGIPVETRAGTIAVVASTTDARMTEGVSNATLILAGLGLVLVGAAVVVGDRLGRNLVQPVDRLAAVARQLGQGELGARATIDGPEEVAAVGTALNVLAGRLGEMITTERESLADLSHRLRTPLTGLRLQAENLPDSEDRVALLAGVDRMQQAVDGLIQKVRRGASQPQRCDAAVVASSRLEFWRVLAGEQQRSMTVDLADGPIPVAVASDELGSMIDGLIGNIFAHTPVAAAFEVRLGRRQQQAVLVVGDCGPGFRPGFDPLRRGASGAGSTGLGLDIARRVAEHAGGTVSIGRSPLGGAEVTVTLPLTP